MKNKSKDCYLGCLIESIKCHHKDFSDYIENNLLLESQMESKKAKEEILINSMKYHNYSYFQTDEIKENGFFYLCMYSYNKLVDFLSELLISYYLKAINYVPLLKRYVSSI